MSFTEVPDLPPNPDVRIFFSGLMILEAAKDGRSCEAFVHRSAPNHVLTIEVRQKQAGKPDLIKMRHVGPLPYALTPPGFPDDPPIHGMTIMVKKAPKGVKAFIAKNPSTEGEGLDLAINLEGADFHPDGVGPISMLDGRPSILLNDAVFYTADKISPQITVDLTRKNAKVKRLAQFASLIGANIYLDPGDHVSLFWRPQGMVEELELVKPDNGISYEIYIVNDPLYESDSILIPEHDEFREYYKLLPEVPLASQFRLEVLKTAGPNVPPVALRGSTRTPCMTVLKNS
jgi:hypothetical protein